VAATVQKIAHYDEDPTKVASMRGGNREMLMQWVNQVNPGYDASQFTNRAPTRKAYTTGTQGQQITAINTAIGHLDQLAPLVADLNNGSFTPGNKIMNTLSSIFGSAKVTNFETLKDALAGEVASVFSKGAATVSGIAAEKEKIKAASSPAQLAGYVKTLIPLMGSKLASLDYQYHQAMGDEDSFSALSPTSKSVLAKYVTNIGEELGQALGTRDVKQIAHAGGEIIGLLAPAILKYGKEAAMTRSVLPTAAKVAVAAPVTTTVAPLKPNPNALETAAVDFGESRGIPIDLATATGSPGFGTIQEKASRHFGGVGTAEAFRRSQVENFQRVGSEIADRVNATRPGQPGVPTSRLDAGAHVTQAFDTSIGDLARTADTYYEQFRALEEQTPMPLDLKPIRAAQSPLRQLFLRLEEENSAVAFMDGTAKAKAFRALKRLMAAPDQAPASIVDGVLSDLKELARGADLPELRNEAQGAAALSVRELEQQLRQAVAQHGGPKAMQLLEDARAATRTKWSLADIRDRFIGNGEPGGIFEKLVRRKDASITLLRDIETAVPGQMPHLGRAVLEEMLDKATENGSFDHTDALFKQWQELGPETKRMLFGGQVGDLTDFFRLAKMIGRRFNSSSTALSLEADKLRHLWKTWPVAKLAYSPGAVRALTRATNVTLLNPTSSKAAKAAAMLNLAKAARNAGLDVHDDDQR
jgi:hypothetical protein